MKKTRENAKEVHRHDVKESFCGIELYQRYIVGLIGEAPMINTESPVDGMDGKFGTTREA